MAASWNNVNSMLPSARIFLIISQIEELLMQYPKSPLRLD